MNARFGCRIIVLSRTETPRIRQEWLRIDQAKRSRLADVKKDLHGKIITYQKLLNTSSRIWLTLEELDGLPCNALSSLDSGEGENTGKLSFPLTMTGFAHALEHVTNEATKRKLYIQNDNRCLDNVRW